MSANGIKRFLITKPPPEKRTKTENGTEQPTPTKPAAFESPVTRTPPVTVPQSTPKTPQTKFTPSKKANVLSPLVATPRRRLAEVQKDDDSPTFCDASDATNHLHLSYDFLYSPKRLDINKRPPDHPDYDEKTLHIPERFLDSQTPALRQWWQIKQKNMDAVLFFKMGKFYELFNEDAVIGVNELDIMYMKGDETKPAHAGFPEVSYEKYSKILIEKGYKVLRIEQTETPAMMEERCNRTGRRGKFDKVVKREVCRVTTRGTQMLGVMETVFHSSQNQYLMAVCETDNPEERNSKIFGVSFIDVTIGRLYISQFEDDHNQSRFNILLAHHKPTEVLYQRGNLSQDTHQALVRTGAQLSVLKPEKEFWTIKKALSYCKTYNLFIDEHGETSWPPLLRTMFHEGESSENLLALEPKEQFVFGLNCFGAIVYYLKSQLIATTVLSCSSFELYRTPLDSASISNDFKSDDEATGLPPMIMDHIALRNLEIFENSDSTTIGTLYESINHCKTHFGQRLLKNWLCSPLRDVEMINNRLDAVEALMSNSNTSLMNEIAYVLGQTPDLERLLSKIKSHCFKSEGDSRAIMFDGDQYSKAKISSFLNLISNFKRVRKFVVSVSTSAKKLESKTLKRLLTFTSDDGMYPVYEDVIEYFDNAFNQDTAKKTGKIIPAPGVDKAYDECQRNLAMIKDQLDDYLESQKAALRCRDIEYFGTAKNRYQLQIPESHCKKVPDEYRIETTRKGFKRYYTPTIEKLFQRLTMFEEEMKQIQDGILSKIFEQFTRKMKYWTAAIDCIAALDVLQSIANFSRSLQATVPISRPLLIDPTACNEGPVVDYKDGRHPSLVKSDPYFTPNDLKLDEKLLLLSGANMGGKSTLMRQTALLVILAQIGCYVPASSMRLVPVDRIFSRLGASDRLIEGESTFYTELVETSAMLRYATKNSLLLLDELGRGTSTYDGTAIAYSVIQEISSNIKCRCLFSTHYHTLVKDFEGLSNVRLAHMACKIEKSVKDSGHDDETMDLDPSKENITFLYKIADGPVARSYGFNVAKLAGINADIIKDAFEKSREIEVGWRVLDYLQRGCKESPKPVVIDELKRNELKSRVALALN